MNTSKSLESVLNELSAKQAAFNSRYWEPKQRRQAEKLWQSYKDEAISAIVEAVEGLIDQPIDIFITNDLPSLLDGGETAAMYYDYFRKKLRQAIKEWQ